MVYYISIYTQYNCFIILFVGCLMVVGLTCRERHCVYHGDNDLANVKLAHVLNTLDIKNDIITSSIVGRHMKFTMNVNECGQVLSMGL